MVTSLVARDLVYDYPGPLRAVNGVGLELARGELVCVLGPNGAGKSTVLKLLAGLLPPSSGTVELDGLRLAALSDRERARRIAVVPQSLRTLPEVTIEDFVLGGRYCHLGSWAKPRGSDREAVGRALAAADLEGQGARVLTRVSGGQRQRVLVARALAQEAEVLLVDEPTNSLDPEHQLAVFEVLARQTCEGHAALVVTHELNLASQFATRLVLVDEGRVVATGSPAQVLRPEVLEPVYGAQLRYGSFPASGAEGTADERPFVLPWRG